MMKLYSGKRSPNARKVRLLARELDLELDIVSPDFMKGELRSPEFLALNPNGKIPVLDDDGFVLWESAAILRYLADKRPERGLYPTDAKERAHVDQWMFWWAAHCEPSLLRLVYERLVKQFMQRGPPDETLVASAESDLARYLPILNQQLEGREHVIGPLTVVDYAFAPWMEAATGLGVVLEQHPNIARWLSKMQSRPYWSDA